MTSLTAEELALAKEYDLTNRLVPFLDRHLVYPLIESLDLLYDESTINQLSYDLLKDTNMVKFIKDKYETLSGSQEYPEELLQKEKFVAEELERLDAATKNTLSILSQKDVQEELRQDKNYNRTYLEKEHGIKEAEINELYEFGQFQYNRGDYVMASDLLNNFRVLSTNSDLNVSATWGRLAAEITRCEWNDALQELKNLRDMIDSRSFQQSDPLQQLHQITWIIHWSLFPFFNIDNGTDQLCDLFMSSLYLSTIQASCPWILRYLTAAVIASQSTVKHTQAQAQQGPSKRLKELIKIINQEQYEYNDPLTAFVKSLYIDFDFAEAQENLRKIEVLVKTDFFLNNIATGILNNARHLITEVYMRVHSRIDINTLLTSLNLGKEQGEKWIANLIRDSKMDAKINESEGTIVLNHENYSVYQTVIEKIKGLSFRSNQILLTASQKQQ